MTKSLALHLIDEAAVVWGPVSIAVSRNTGGPFGLASSMSAVWLAVAVLGAVTAVWGVTRVGRIDAVTVAAAIVAGGVFGNLADRVARGRAGAVPGVIDWIILDPYPSRSTSPMSRFARVRWHWSWPPFDEDLKPFDGVLVE